LLRDMDCSTEGLPVSVPTVPGESNCKPGDIVHV